MLGANPAIACDQECDRQSENSSVKLTGFRGAHHHRVIHFELLVEVAHRFGSIIHGNADDLQALAAVLVLQFDEMRNLVPAGRAPGCPEIHKNHLAPIGGEIEFLSG